MQVVDRVTAAQQRLDFGEAGRAVYDFFWSQFADWYIEAAKTRLYSEDAAAARTTRAVRLLPPCPARLPAGALRVRRLRDNRWKACN